MILNPPFPFKPSIIEGLILSIPSSSITLASKVNNIDPQKNEERGKTLFNLGLPPLVNYPNSDEGRALASIGFYHGGAMSL